jgi:hypothetical protein
MMTLAFLAVVMPTSTMASIADWLGVGPLHRAPLTEYLTRSLSALYGRVVEARYSTGPQRSAFFAAALQRIRALPGVVSAGTIDTVPFADGEAQILGLEGQGPRRDAPVVQVRQISPGYARAMGFRCCVDATLRRAIRTRC